jgi:LPS-assembly lipoprotein
MVRTLLLFACFFILTGCGFHLQGEAKLAPPLHRLYLQTPDPYGTLARNLKQYLKMSKVKLVSSPNLAETILIVARDEAAQEFLSVSGTAQTRQYRLKVTVVFEITNAKGQVIVDPQTLVEERIITIQSNQILGSSNETALFYQQMRRALAYAIINRIASKEITRAIDNFYSNPKPQTSL